MNNLPEISEEEKEKIKKLLPAIRNKRARIVIEHILRHGYITTEEIERHGYKHPPRAARDVREAGIPLETFYVKSSDGSKTIAAYRFGVLSQIRENKLQGRKTFSKKLKKQLYEKQKGRCAICEAQFEMRYLQIDHRIPYEIGGEVDNAEDFSRYMLLCGTCNRAKSWSCEHCPNWEDKMAEQCQKCYWATPEHYTHVAMIQARRLDILFIGDDEVATYDRMKQKAQFEGLLMPEYVKNVLKKALGSS